MTQLPPPPSTNPGARSPSAQGSNIPLGWKPTPAKPIPVVRCTYVRDDGEQCDNWSIRGATVCRKHGGSLPVVKKHAEDVVVAAKLRLMGTAPDAMDVLEELLQPGVGEGIRLKAATEILDRAGLKPGMEVNVTVEDNRSPLEDLMSQLSMMSERLEDEGEILEEPTIEPDGSEESEYSQTLQEIEEAKD